VLCLGTCVCQCARGEGGLCAWFPEVGCVVPVPVCSCGHVGRCALRCTCTHLLPIILQPCRFLAPAGACTTCARARGVSTRQPPQQCTCKQQCQCTRAGSLPRLHARMHPSAHSLAPFRGQLRMDIFTMMSMWWRCLLPSKPVMKWCTSAQTIVSTKPEGWKRCPSPAWQCWQPAAQQQGQQQQRQRPARPHTSPPRCHGSSSSSSPHSNAPPPSSSSSSRAAAVMHAAPPPPGEGRVPTTASRKPPRWPASCTSSAGSTTTYSSSPNRGCTPAPMPRTEEGRAGRRAARGA